MPLLGYISQSLGFNTLFKDFISFESQSIRSMRGIVVGVVLLLAIISLAHCQQTANIWTISGFDLENSDRYNKAINSGLNYYYQGKYEEAIDAYDQAINLDPNSTQTWQAWKGKGDALYGQEKYEEAIIAYVEAIKLRPEDGMTWAYKGDALKQLGKTNESDEAYAKAKELGFLGSTWRPKPITLEESPIPDKGLQMTSQINKGLELYSKGKYEEAIVAYEDAVRLDPNDAKTWAAWKGKGDALSALGQSDEARLAYTTADDLHALLNETSRSGTTPVTHILDHCIARNLNESTNEVIEKSYEFSEADRKIYSWVNFGNIGPGRVEWYWYSPDNNLFRTSSFEIPENASGERWSSYNVWSFINISDIPAEPYNSGNWRVEVYLAGQTYVAHLTENFAVQISGTLPKEGSEHITRILDHCMSNNVDETSHSPVTRSSEFLLDRDQLIFSWLSLGDVGPGTFYWFWHSPDGRVYKIGPVEIPPNPDGGYWPIYNIWTKINAADLYGETWNLELPSNEFYVDVTRNGYQIHSEHFTLDQYAKS